MSDEQTSTDTRAGARADVRTAEEWAAAKGFLPQFTTVAVRGIGGRAEAQPRGNPKYHEFVQAKSLKGWPEGKELTAEQFDAAIEEGKRISLR